jgi:hypothetical protein
MGRERKEKVRRIHPEYTPEEKPLPPAQYNLFTGEAEAVPILIDETRDDETVLEEGITVVKSGDSSQVILSGYGIFLSKKSERMLVKKSKRTSSTSSPCSGSTRW